MRELLRDLNKVTVLKKISLFLIGGGINLFLKILLTIIFTEILGFMYFSSYIITLILIIIFSYFYNAYLTFKSSSQLKFNFIKYTIALLVFNFIDAYLVKYLTETLGMYYVISIFLVALVMLISKFIVYDKIVFVKL